MDVFQDMPLNMAHLYERKAENCLECEDEAGAIQYYKLACDYVLKAKECTSCIKSLQILDLQYEAYLKQSNVKLKHKALRTDVIGNSVVETSDVSKTCETQVDEGHLVKETEYSRQKYNPIAVFPDREPDSLLQFLNPSNGDKKVKKQRKFPKAEKDVIEELKTQNQHLQELVKNLMEKQEKIETENRLLIAKVNALQMENKELQNQQRSSYKKASHDAEESYSTPHFVIDQDVEPTSIVQQQSFFDFDDPIIAYNLRNAMDEIAEPLNVITENTEEIKYVRRKLCPVQEFSLSTSSNSFEMKKQLTNTKSIQYEELEDNLCDD